jgi:hypothetical protein
MPEVTLRLLVLQFLVAAIFWVGSAPLARFRWDRGPGWMQVELTRVVLPLLMVGAGLLFFSASLAPAWQAALFLQAFPGIPPAWGRWAFLGLNLGMAGMVLVATGGTPRSPFLPLVPALPLFVWAVGAPAPEVLVGGLMAVAVLLWGLRTVEHPWDPGRPQGGEGGRAGRESRFPTLFASLLTLLAALWMGGRLGG